VNERAETALTEVAPGQKQGTFLEVLGVSTRLGLTSFGGPIAHLGYFHEEYVKRRKWIDEQSYADLIALCQFLPGPASSQVSIAIGIARAALPGGFAAWLGFTWPSALALIAFAFGIGGLASTTDAGWLHGLKVVAAAVVAQALWGMARSLCPDRERATITILASIVTLAWPTVIGQLSSIAIAAVAGLIIFRETAPSSLSHIRFPVKKSTGIAAWIILFALLLGLPLLRQIAPSHALEVFDSFFRVGSLVFGGGHVVLPLLQTEVVGPGWVSNEQFLAGYGAAQAVPGPLFTFAAYLGAVMGPEPNRWTGAMLALVAIFLPSFFLVDHRGAALLGSSPIGASLPVRSERRQRGGGWTAIDCFLYADMDQRDPFSGRFRPWTYWFWATHVLEMSPLARCPVDGPRRRNDRPYLTVNDQRHSITKC
jgi:chromate transporter